MKIFIQKEKQILNIIYVILKFIYALLYSPFVFLEPMKHFLPYFDRWWRWPDENN